MDVIHDDIIADDIIRNKKPPFDIFKWNSGAMVVKKITSENTNECPFKWYSTLETVSNGNFFGYGETKKDSINDLKKNIKDLSGLDIEIPVI